MASFIARNRPQGPLSVCEACLKHLAPSPKSTNVSLRFFCNATRPTATRPRHDRSPDIRQTRLRKQSTISASNSIVEADITENNENGAFLTQGPLSRSAIPSKHQSTKLADRQLIAVSGPDAAKFLQGLITNNVDSANTDPFYAAFLDARGRMLHDVFIWTYPDLHREASMIGAKGMGEWACYIDVTMAQRETLMKHLKRHKLRSKVDIRIVKSEGENEENSEVDPQVWAIWGGDEATKELCAQHDFLATIKDPRFISHSMPMERVLLRPKRGQASGQTSMLGEAYREYLELRYRHGVIEGNEIPTETNAVNKGSALPMEYNVDISNGIDFKKGCYVGQELTIRTKHTGVVRKRILPVELSLLNLHNSDTESTTSEEGSILDPSHFDTADIKQLDENNTIKKGRAAGKLISVAGNLGLALCRLEMMTPMKVSAEGGSWKPGMEFGLEDRNGGILKVKPVLRDGWVAKVRDLWDKKRERI